jgi:hypothetical protein
MAPGGAAERTVPIGSDRSPTASMGDWAGLIPIYGNHAGVGQREYNKHTTSLPHAGSAATPLVPLCQQNPSRTAGQGGKSGSAPPAGRAHPRTAGPTEPAPPPIAPAVGARAFAIDPSGPRFYTRPGEPVAQMVEHLTFNQVVLGSSPSGLTNKIKALDQNQEWIASQKARLGSIWEAPLWSFPISPFTPATLSVSLSRAA